MEKNKNLKKGVATKLIIMFLSLIAVGALALFGFWLFGLQHLCALTSGFMCFLDNPYFK